ncbi:aminotransferase class I/II-fold pyridoxal phosphate-dependent enzyme [Thermococcus sp.]
MSEERRKAVAELAEKYDFLIIENNPYGELRYHGKDIRPIKTFAPERTIYLGTFSKIFAPGFRIAWIVAPENIVDRFEVATDC